MQKTKPKFVFLYTELAGYFLSCINKLINTQDVDIYIIRWPINKEAPFDFSFHPLLNVKNRNDFSSRSEIFNYIIQINPDLIYVSGWNDKFYLHICRAFVHKIPVIVGIDNQWNASFKQILASTVGRFFIKKYFNHAWVPGNKQLIYAKKLGFHTANIHTGLYCADTDHFLSIYNHYSPQKHNKFPHKFIFVGRYLPFKGIFNLWQAFVELSEEINHDWELWCLGTGDSWNNKTIHPKIKHFGFVQPDKINNFIKETGVFILPSSFEPWGVVVHEFALSGYPLILTTQVGASEYFLKNNYNGLLLTDNSVANIKEALKTFIQSNDNTLIQMSIHSHNMALQYTTDNWTQTLINIYLNSKK